MDSSRLTQPWYRHSALYSSPRTLILKLALGEAPEHIPAYVDVQSGAQEYARSIDGGAVDRALGNYASSWRASRLHASAAALYCDGERHFAYNDLEQQFGLARTFRIEVDAGCNIGYLLNALRPLTVVEEAYPHYFSTLPFDDVVAA